MYNMIIIDDELPTRERMQYILDWKQMNIDIVGVAANGIEGLPLLRSELEITGNNCRKQKLNSMGG